MTGTVLVAIAVILRVILASSTIFAFISWCIFGALFSFIVLFFYKTRLNTEFRRTVKLKNMNKFFQEKEIKKKIIGSIIMILGSVLIILLEN